MNYKDTLIYYFSWWCLLFFVIFIDKIYRISYTEYIDYPMYVFLSFITIFSYFLKLNIKDIVLLYFLFLIPEFYEISIKYELYYDVFSSIIESTISPVVFILPIVITLGIKFFIKKTKFLSGKYMANKRF